MAETIDMGPFFVHTIKLRKGAPFLHTATTNEVEYPYRRSEKSLVVKIWPGWGLVFGRWRHTGRSETEALIDAVQGRDDAMTTDEIRDKSRRFDDVPDDILV